MWKDIATNVSWIFDGDVYYPATNLTSWIVRIVLSTVCNYRCPHCFQEWETIKNDRTLSPGFITRVMGFGKKHYGIHTARLTWWEPLIYHQLKELFVGLREVGITNIDLTTNWTFLEKNIDLLKEFWISFVTVTLNSLNPVTYDKFSGTKGMLSIVLAWIQKAKAAGIKININLTVLNEIPREEIREVIRYANDNWFIIRLCEPTYVVGKDSSKDKDCFRKLYEDILSQNKKVIHSMCESVIYVTLLDDTQVTIMSNLCDNRFCNSCGKYLYLRLTTEKKLKPCLSKTDTEVTIPDDASDDELHKIFCIAIANMGNGLKDSCSKWLNLSQ